MFAVENLSYDEFGSTKLLELIADRSLASGGLDRILPPHQPGVNLQAEVLEQPGLVAFDGNRAHHGVVGAEPQGGDVKLHVAGGRFFLQPRAETGVGRHAAAHAELPQAGATQRRKCLVQKHIDHGFLETGRQVRDLLRRKLDLRQVRPPGPAMR